MQKTGRKEKVWIKNQQNRKGKGCQYRIKQSVYSFIKQEPHEVCIIECSDRACTLIMSVKEDLVLKVEVLGN